VVGEHGFDVGGRSALGSVAGDEEGLVGHALAEREGVFGFGGPHYCSDVAQAHAAHVLVAEGGGVVGEHFGDGAAVGEFGGLDAVAVWVACANEDEDAEAGFEVGLDGAGAEVGVGGDGVGAQPPPLRWPRRSARRRCRCRRAWHPGGW